MLCTVQLVSSILLCPWLWKHPTVAASAFRCFRSFFPLRSEAFITSCIHCYFAPGMLAKYEVSLLKNAELDWMIHLNDCFWFPVSVLFWKCFSIISSVKTRISNAFLVWPKTHPAERTEVTGSWAVHFELLLTGDARLQENSTIQNMSILLLSRHSY